MGFQSLTFLLAVLTFWALFGAPWPEGLAPLQPSAWGTLPQVIVGATIIVGHWLANRTRQRSRREVEEGADASYFLGFIMTMLFLVFRLMQSEGGVNAEWIASFIHDMGVAFSFSVIGLTVRQLQVLRRAGDYSAAESPEAAGESSVAGDAAVRSAVLDASAVSTARIEQSFTAAAERIEQSIARVAQVAATPPDQRMAEMMFGFEERLAHTAGRLEGALGSLNDPTVRSAFDKALRGLEERVTDSTSRLSEALDRATQATVRSSMEIEGASSRLRGGLQRDMESLGSEVSRVVEEVAGGRQRLLAVLASTTAQAEETQRLVSVASRKQAAEWEDQLRATHAHLIAMRSALEDECRDALSALDRSSSALIAMCDVVVQRTNQLANPSERLRELWTSIGEQEDSMVASVARASGALTELARASQASAGELGKLGAGSQESARLVGESAALMRTTLAKEAQEMHKLVDELVNVLEERIELVGKN